MDSTLDGALRCVQAQAQRRAFQVPYLEELRTLDIPCIEMPFLFQATFGREAITTLSDHILAEIATLEGA